MKNKIMLFFVCSIIPFFLSCNKSEGTGGKTTIRGKIITRLFDQDYKIFQSEHPSTETDVYLVYGSNEYYGKSVSTNMNGIFEFPYMRPGNYKVFIYSSDSTKSIPSGKIVVEKSITISNNDETIDIGTLYRTKALDMNDGFATICGKIRSLNYEKNFLSFIDTTAAQGEDVYIIYENNNASFDRIKTDFDGSFCFTNLIKGKYTVYALSDNKSGSAQQIAEKRMITIDNEYQSSKTTDVFVVRER